MFVFLGQFSSVQSLSPVRLSETPWTAACQASLSITNSWSYPNPSPLSRWCHPTISSSVVPFSSSLQSFPASGSFQMSQLFKSGGQSTGVSALTSVLPMNIQDWFPLEWASWISLLSKGPSRVFSNTTVQTSNSNTTVQKSSLNVWKKKDTLLQNHTTINTPKKIYLNSKLST